MIEIRVPDPAGRRQRVREGRAPGRRLGVAAAGAVLWLDGGPIADAGIGLTALGAAHFVAAEAEDVLRGAAATDEAFAEAGRLAAEHSNPIADQRGPVDYKRHLAEELTRRALRRAADRRCSGQEADDAGHHDRQRRPSTRDVEPRLLLVHFLRETSA